MKKTIFMAAAAILIFGNLGGNAHSAREFNDTAGHWAKASIETAVSKGYVDGYPDGTFQPDANVTRAEFIKLASTALKLPAGNESVGDDWYKPYVQAAVSKGIHRYEEFNQDINGPITRQEMARIIVRSSDTELLKQGAALDDKSFVYKATRSGLIQGLSGGELGLDQPTTRGQAVTVIDRVLRANAGEKLPADKAATSYAEVALRGTNLGTMFNALPKLLPMDINIGGDLKTQLVEVIVVDMTDPDSAYYDWFKDAYKISKKPMGDDYLVSLHLKIKNTEAQGHNYINVNRSINLMNYSQNNMPANSSSPVKTFPLIWLDQVGSYDGWYLATVSKKYVQQAFEQGGYEEPSISRINASGSYDLTERKVNP